MKREVKIGIFAVAILLCSWAGIRFLSGLDVFSRNKTYYANYEQVSGVAIASPILVRGVKVGQVSAITLDQTKRDGVRLSLSIQRKYSIPKDSQAKIAGTGLLGGKSIEIVLGSSDELLSGGDYIQTVEDTDLMSVAGSELEDLKGKIDNVVERLTVTLDNVSQLIEANQQNINGVISHIDSMTGTLDDVLTGSKRELKDIVENLSHFAEALGSDKVDSLLVNINTISGQFADADVANNLRMTLDRLNVILDGFSDGDGTVSKLLYDKELYDNLTSASANLSSLLNDLEEHPKRYVHFSLFGRSAKADEKARAAEKAEK